MKSENTWQRASTNNCLLEREKKNDKLRETAFRRGESDRIERMEFNFTAQ